MRQDELMLEVPNYRNQPESFTVSAQEQAAYEELGLSEDLQLADTTAAYFGFASLEQSLRLQEHFQIGNGTELDVPVDQLLRDEPDLEDQLLSLLSAELAVINEPTTEAPTTFDTGWMSYEAIEGDWSLALATFDFRLIGEIVPGGQDDVEATALRYRVFIADVYDFELGDWRTDHLARLALHGFAHEFRVTGSSATTCLAGPDFELLEFLPS